MSTVREYDVSREPDASPRAVRYLKLQQNVAKAQEASERQERLKHLGLPPQRRHTVQTSEKNANAAAADGFFASHRSEQQRWRIATERVPRVTTSTVERLVASGALSTASEVLQRQLSVRHSRDQTQMKQAKILRAVRAKWGEQIMDEVRMDARARSLRGGDPILIRPEFERRVRLIAASQLHGVRDDGEFERRLQRIERSESRRVPAVAGYELPLTADHTSFPGSIAPPNTVATSSQSIN